MPFSVDFIGRFLDSQMPTQNEDVQISRPEAYQRGESTDLVVWHLTTDRDLEAILANRPKSRVLVVSGGGATRNSTGRVDDIRVFGTTRERSTYEVRPRWADLLRFFRDGQPTPDIEAFLGLEMPVVRAAVALALEIALRELDKPQKRMDIPELLRPALHLLSERGALVNVREQIDNACHVESETERKSLLHEALQLVRADAVVSRSA